MEHLPGFEPPQFYYVQGRYLMDDYPMSKDEIERQRLDLQHRLLREGLGRNHFAPVRRPRAILNVGSGSGIWCREMARLFPFARVLGLDITEVYEAYARAHLPEKDQPTNYHFLRADALLGFPFQGDSSDAFDLVHSRFLAVWVHQQRWPWMVAEMARVSRPGGWVESVESTLPECEGPSYQVLRQTGIRLFEQLMGRYNPGPQVAGWMQAAGLERVQMKQQVLGAGTSKEALRLQKLIAEDMLLGFSWSSYPLLLKMGGFTKETLDHHVAAMREELAALPISMIVYVTTGQKPKKIDG